MTREKFIELMGQMVENETKVLETKGQEYARDEYGDDVLANFKRNGKMVGIGTLHVWANYLMKHIDAILNYVRLGKAVSEEDISSRILDARNYLLLGMAIILEEGNFSRPKNLQEILEDADQPTQKQASAITYAIGRKKNGLLKKKKRGWPKGKPRKNEQD